MTKLGNTAAPQAAGYILQLERALYHLAHAARASSVVAVEHLDDVSVHDGPKIVLQEQDKLTASQKTKLLSDRSKAIWRTLEIWLEQRYGAAPKSCDRYLFFVNRSVNTPVASLLKQRASGAVTSAKVLEALKAVGSPPPKRARKPGAKPPKAAAKTRTQALIDRVLAYTDVELTSLIDRIEIVEATDPADDRASMANGLGLSRRVDADGILDGLLGWLTRRMRIEWAEGRPGLITRQEVLSQKDALQAQQARGRLLPRAASDIVVEEADRQGALSRTFVEHLGRIEAEPDDIFSAVDHFLKFSVEKHRLAREGEVADREWADRGHRLRERWQGLLRRHRRGLPTMSPSQVGHLILDDATYDYREPLDGNACDELYMTSGHYHRLADEDQVWWDPTFKPATPRED